MHVTSVTCLGPLGGFSHTTHVEILHGAMWHHAKYHPTPHASKSVKFQLSRNPTKFERVARFCETIPTVKSVSSSEIYKISRFYLVLFRQNYRFALFQKK